MMNQQPLRSALAAGFAAPIMAGIGLAGVLLAAGCGSSQQERFGLRGGVPASLEARASGFQLNDTDWGNLGYRRDWTGFPVVTTGGSISRVEPYTDVVVVQEGGSTVTGLNAVNGQRMWAIQLADRLRRFTDIHRFGERLVIASEPELFLVSAVNGGFVDPEGAFFSSRQPFDRVVNTSGVMLGALMIYGTASGEVLGHRLDTGMQRWAFGVGGAVEYAPVQVSGDNADGIIGAVSQSGRYVFVEGGSGRFISEGRLFGGAGAQPVAAAGLMIVAGLDQSLWGLSSDGTVPWRIRTSRPLTEPPATDGTTVWVWLGENGLSAVDASTGKVRWSARLPDETPLPGRVVAMHNDQLVVFDGRFTSTVDAKRGDIIARHETPGIAFIRTEKFVNGPLYLVAKSGVVTKVLPR